MDATKTTTAKDKKTSLGGPRIETRRRVEGVGGWSQVVVALNDRRGGGGRGECSRQNGFN